MVLFIYGGDILVFRKTYERVPVRLRCDSPSVCETEWKDGCDIRNILKHYGQTSDWNLLELPPRRISANPDLDVIDMSLDLHEQLTSMRDGLDVFARFNASFQQLSALDRAKYHNDVFEYVESLAQQQSGVSSAADSVVQTEKVDSEAAKVDTEKT